MKRIGQILKSILGRQNKMVFALTFLFQMTIPSYSNINFYNINDLFGVSKRETFSVINDDFGFIWVSSTTSVLRISDDDLRIYHLALESPGIVTVKLEYSSLGLYAYTNNGQIFRYNKILDRFDLIENFSTLLNSEFLIINNLLVDVDGRLIVSANEGVLIYDEGEIVLYKTDRLVLEVEFYNDSVVFVGTDGAIELFDIRNQKRIEGVFDLSTGTKKITRLRYRAAENDLWIGTESSGLFRYNLINSSLEMISDVPRQPILAIDFNSDTTMLVGVDGQGLWHINRQTNQVINNYKENVDRPFSLRGNGVYDVLSTPSGRVWVCTYSGGVSYYDVMPSSLTHLAHIINEPNSLVNNDVNDVLEDGDGNLWFATNNGLSKWDILSDQWTSFYHNNEKQAQVFLTLSEDSNGNIWAGSYSSGVYVLHRTTGKEIHHFSTESEGDIFNNNFVFALLEDSRKNMWIAGVKGNVFKYSLLDNSFVDYGSNAVSALAVWKDSWILLGCSYGLSILNINSKSYSIILPGYLINDMLLENDNVWLCTVGEGLVRYNMSSGEVEKFGFEAGLPSILVNSIKSDGTYYWLGTENGICKFNPLTGVAESFPSVMNLSRVSYNRKSVFRRKNGDLIWGTSNGVVIFDPTKIQQSEYEGKLFLQDILVLGSSIRKIWADELEESVNDIDYLELKSSQNSISIEMLPLAMALGAKFSWMLEGLDSEWSNPSDYRVINYSNLQRGEYILRIRMYDNSMMNIVDERVLKIRKLPAFWETWWFLVKP